MSTELEIIETLAGQVKKPTTVIVSKERYEALCREFTPNTDEYETIDLTKIFTTFGSLDIRVVDTCNNTLIVQ